MAISPKVSASTVAASLSTVVIGIVGPHVFPHGTPADVQGLVSAAVLALVTFGSGYMARAEAVVTREVAKADTVFTEVKQAAAPIIADVAQAVAPQAVPAVAVPLPVAQPQA